MRAACDAFAAAANNIAAALRAMRCKQLELEIQADLEYGRD